MFLVINPLSPKVTTGVVIRINKLVKLILFKAIPEINLSILPPNRGVINVKSSHYNPDYISHFVVSRS